MINGVDIKALAAKGAQARLIEIETEIAALRTMFPELAISVPAAAPAATANELAPKKMRMMSPASRAAISKRMKQYWREKQKQERPTT